VRRKSLRENLPKPAIRAGRGRDGDERKRPTETKTAITGRQTIPGRVVKCVKTRRTTKRETVRGVNSRSRCWRPAGWLRVARKTRA